MATDGARASVDVMQVVDNYVWHTPYLYSSGFPLFDYSASAPRIT